MITIAKQPGPISCLSQRWSGSVPRPHASVRIAGLRGPSKHCCTQREL